MMKSDYYAALTFDGCVYCVDCLPEGVNEDDDEVHPIFADSEWGYVLDCDACGALHHYVNTISDD